MTMWWCVLRKFLKALKPAAPVARSPLLSTPLSSELIEARRDRGWSVAASRSAGDRS